MFFAASNFFFVDWLAGGPGGLIVAAAASQVAVFQLSSGSRLKPLGTMVKPPG